MTCKSFLVSHEYVNTLQREDNNYQKLTLAREAVEILQCISFCNLVFLGMEHQDAVDGIPLLFVFLAP